jgi:hypothetical protein
MVPVRNHKGKNVAWLRDPRAILLKIYTVPRQAVEAKAHV